MNRYRVSLIAGARPNFMKIAPLIPALEAVGLNTRLIHTGQHYDKRMSETFFDELNIPKPDVNLGVGSGSHIWQISEVMRLLEQEFTDHRPDAVVVVGDVNSTMSASIAANKLGIRVAHVEAGLRSFDREMPEEINRIITDSISDWLFTSEPSGNENLIRERIPEDRIFMVGNVMIDSLLDHIDRARALNSCREFGMEPGRYAVLTLHRPSNVDCKERFESILRAVHEVSEQLPVLFALHPRTRARLQEFGFTHRPELNGFHAIGPQGYHSMLSLMDSARLVLTDSGGIQEETTILGVPCLTLRENTERPVTIDQGSNKLVGWRSQDIVRAFSEVMSDPSPTFGVPEKWDGKSARRIAAVLSESVFGQ